MILKESLTGPGGHRVGLRRRGDGEDAARSALGTSSGAARGSDRGAVGLRMLDSRLTSPEGEESCFTA